MTQFRVLFDGLNLESFGKSRLAHDRLLVLNFREQGVCKSKGNSIHQDQMSARNIYHDWAATTKHDVIVSTAPWILVYLGSNCEAVISKFATNYSIFIQDQTDKAKGLEGWARISVNVPCDAHRVTRALDEVLQEFDDGYNILF